MTSPGNQIGGADGHAARDSIIVAMLAFMGIMANRYVDDGQVDEWQPDPEPEWPISAGLIALYMGFRDLIWRD